MPYDLQAVERGFGEVTVEWNGHTILLRYRADLNARALIAMKRAIVGELTLDGKTRFPDIEAIINELLRVLVPSTPDVPEDQRGWDITRGSEPLEITFDTLADLEYGLLASMLGAISRDINDPQRRKVSRLGSSLEAVSQPTPFPTTGDSSRTPGTSASTPQNLPTPIGSTQPPADPNLQTSNLHAVGLVGASG